MTHAVHQVSTDALDTLGTTLTGSPGRDAIHLAVLPAIAAVTLHPGTHVHLNEGKAYPGGNKTLGVVDPFIRGPVLAGEQFWLVVYPRVITSLRHVWSHPAIPE